MGVHKGVCCVRCGCRRRQKSEGKSGSSEPATNLPPSPQAYKPPLPSPRPPTLASLLPIFIPKPKILGQFHPNSTIGFQDSLESIRRLSRTLSCLTSTQYQPRLPPPFCRNPFVTSPALLVLTYSLIADGMIPSFRTWPTCNSPPMHPDMVNFKVTKSSPR